MGTWKNLKPQARCVWELASTRVPGTLSYKNSCLVGSWELWDFHKPSAKDEFTNFIGTRSTRKHTRSCHQVEYISQLLITVSLGIRPAGCCTIHFSKQCCNFQISTSEWFNDRFNIVDKRIRKQNDGSAEMIKHAILEKEIGSRVVAEIMEEVW